jgi:hypothetical protein
MGMGMHLMNEVVRAGLQSQLLSCFVTGHMHSAASRLAIEDPASGHQPADRDRHGVGVAEEEIA